MATDGRRTAPQSIWDKLEAERKPGPAETPFGTNLDEWAGTGGMPNRPSEAEQKKKWAADLAAVAEQRAGEPPKPTQTSTSHTRTLNQSLRPASPNRTAPFGLEHDNLSQGQPDAAREEPSAVPQDRAAVQQRWRQQLDSSQSGPRVFGRKFADVHHRSGASGHGAVLSSDGAMTAKEPAATAAGGKSKAEVVASLAQQPRPRTAEDGGAVAKLSPRQMSRARLDALSAPKQMYSPREGEATARRPSSAGSSASSTGRSAASSDSRPCSRGAAAARGPSSLQGRQAWKAVAGAARESLGDETWCSMSRGEKKEFLRAAITSDEQQQPQPEVARGCSAMPASGDDDARSVASMSSLGSGAFDGLELGGGSARRGSSASSSTASSRISSVRSAGGGSARSGSRCSGTGVVDVHASSNWHISEQFQGTKDGHQDDRFVSQTRATLHKAVAAAAAPAPEAQQLRNATDVHATSNWSFTDQFAGSSDGHQSNRFVTSQTRASLAPLSGAVAAAAAPRQVHSTAKLQSSSFSLG